jgi:hypothetical protein
LTHGRERHHMVKALYIGLLAWPDSEYPNEHKVLDSASPDDLR